MHAVSLTFHCTPDHVEKWETFAHETLTLLADNLLQAENYYLSEVASDFITEGKNYNLLILFETEELRQEFFLHELPNITERVEKAFGQEVMIFDSKLNIFAHR